MTAGAAARAARSCGSMTISSTGVDELRKIQKASVASRAGEASAGSAIMGAANRASAAGSPRRSRQWNGVRSDGLAEPRLQLDPAAAAQLELGSVLQQH